MDIRRLTEDDRADLTSIRLELFPDDAGVEWPVDEYLSGHGAAFGAFAGDDLVGYAAAGLRSHAEGAWGRPPSEQRIAYLEEWYVQPGHRRRRLGRALVEAVEDWSSDIRATHLASDTELANDVSVAAHQALGLAEVERAVHFLKEITPGAPDDHPPADQVELRELDEESGRDIMRLRVAPTQQDFVAPNAISLAQAFLTDDVWVRGVYAGGVPVGFAMLSTKSRRYYLWRYMIDHRYQGRGYGRRAMELIIEHVRTQPGADRMFLSYVPAPGGPEGFYRSLGFVDTGKVHGIEREMELIL